LSLLRFFVLFCFCCFSFSFSFFLSSWAVVIYNYCGIFVVVIFDCGGFWLMTGMVVERKKKRKERERNEIGFSKAKSKREVGAKRKKKNNDKK